MAVNVFDHQNRVVHQHAYRHDHRQQGQQVDRVAHDLHVKNDTDDRQRNGYQRYQRRAEGTQRQEDNGNHDYRGDRQGADHLVDRCLDKFGGIVGYRRLQAGREGFLELGEFLVDQLDRGQRVAVGGAVDGDVDRGNAVEHDQRVVTLGAEFDIGDIAQAHHVHAVVADHETPENVRIARVGNRVDVGLHQLAAGCTGGRLVVLLADCVDDIGRRNVQRGHPHRVHPDAHRVGLAAENFGRGDAAHGRQRRLHGAQQVIGYLDVGKALAVKAVIGQREPHGRLLGDDRVFGLGRQLAANRSHLGADFGQRSVGIDAEFHVHLDARNAVAAAGAHEVDSFGTGDDLLDWSADKSLDQLCAGARVGGRDTDHRGLELRILPHLGVEECLQAEQHDQRADDHGQYRAPDEIIREHRLIPRLFASIGLRRRRSPP